MHGFLSMKTSIEYLHVRLKSCLGITQNEVKTSPALITAQISISAAFFLPFEPRVEHKIHSKTKFCKPLSEENDSDIILALQN